MVAPLVVTFASKAAQYWDKSDKSKSDKANNILAGSYLDNNKLLDQKKSNTVAAINTAGLSLLGGSSKKDREMSRIQEHTNTINNAYREVLGRDPDAGGFQAYMNAILNGEITSPDQLKQRLMDSDEYRNKSAPEEEGGGFEEYGGGVDLSQLNDMMNNQSEAEWNNYLKYAPQSAEMEYQLYSQYAPLYAQKSKEMIDKLYPNQSGLGELLAADVTKRLKDEGYEVPKVLAEQYKRNRAGADSNRGLYTSGMSSRQESVDLAELGMKLREQDINTALNLNSQVPKASIPNSISKYVPSTPDYTSAMLGYNANMAGLASNESLAADDFINKLELQRQKYGFESDLSEENRNYAAANEPNPWTKAASDPENWKTAAEIISKFF
jgi:hypothetical protein